MSPALLQPRGGEHRPRLACLTPGNDEARELTRRAGE
jgi:hypothetical protein